MTRAVQFAKIDKARFPRAVMHPVLALTYSRGKIMRLLITGIALLAASWLINDTSAMAHESSVLLTPRQARTYHQCLAAAWIQEWCHGYAHRVPADFGRAFPSCVVANHGRPYLLHGHYWNDTDEFCWRRAKGIIR
jgi:hypothetical protein